MQNQARVKKHKGALIISKKPLEKNTTYNMEFYSKVRMGVIQKVHVVTNISWKFGSVFILFLSQLSRRLIGKLIVIQWSFVRPSVHRPQCLNIFSETTGPIKTKFYVEPPSIGGTKVRGIWVTWQKWPPRPYMVKPFKNLLPQNVDRFQWNLVCSIWDSSLSVGSNDDPRLTLTYFTARSYLVT